MLTHKDKHAILALISLRCSNPSTSDNASKYNENCCCQVVISRTSGDTMFEGYLHATDERSTVVVGCYACVKEAREPLF